MSDNQSASTGALKGRTVLVTGAASGIGRATAIAMAREGGRVLVHARTESAAREAAASLPAPRDGGASIPVAADLGSLAGVRHLAARVTEHTPEGLHVVVNNAGAAFAEHALSPDGVERTLAVNHVAVAALTDALLGQLQAGAARSGRPSRVVNLSSVVEKRGKPVTDWRYPGTYKQLQAYADSKLMNLLYSNALADRLTGSGVTVNAANPGSVATGFGAKAGGLLRVMMVVGKPFMAGPDKGARTSIRLALDPALDEETGGYYSVAHLDTSSAQSRDAALREQVYGRTQALLENAAA